ncbi:conserved oligomeric Golgi complex subunit 3-like isoform X2 [Pomacea canaliculata]|uniref:conserved oligomeric Golgi complex subunit 3-like isoform X2 n=1 Tax=Pomacea canaliculata TaxID=400727 RepID=UPI000D73F8E8|nr:conserved oligomeric Golgi complex subunit 3-like isoform X2 [Pomacea canaliculata]
MADTLHSRPVNQRIIRDRLSLWEAKTNPTAPLTSKQKDALMELTAIAAERPLPPELPEDDIPLLPLRETSSSNASEQGDFLGDFIQQSLPGGQKIENAQQFFSWFSHLDDALEHEEEELYRPYLESLCMYQTQCDTVLQEVTQCVDFLRQLHQQYINVSTKTNALHDECEHLLAEQTQLMNTAESISNKLSYFNELDTITTKLSRQTLSVTDESFVPMLSRIDECIHYMQSNPHFKESETYLLQFRQCLSRALGHIRTYVTNILTAATQAVTPQKDAPNMADNAFTLFYGKFRANAPRVKPLTEQVESRLDKGPEYHQVLEDLHNCYFAQREILLTPSISTTINDLASKHSRDHCALVRSGCAFMVHVCEDEYQLFLNFFSRPTPGLDGMLERLCNHLYDVFRPFIIHIQHLETLAELCSILKVEMMEEHVRQNPQELKAFATICQQMLMDVQERLVYRTYIFIRSDILQYNAAPGDLAYPEKLEMMESIAESLKKTSKPTHGSHSRTPSNASSTSAEVAQLTSHPDATVISSEMLGATEGSGAAGSEDSQLIDVPLDRSTEDMVSNMPMSPADLHGMWYPTVRRTLVTLSKLYRCIDKTTFQGLSQEALQACVESLKNARDGIIKRKTALDGQLFLVKHLLILREQIAPFQADFCIRETHLDFSKIKDAAYGLLQKKSQLFSFNTNNALLQFILEGTPQVTEMFVDSKRDVDQQLKSTCEDFIRLVTDMFTVPLTTFLSRATVVVSMKKEDGTPRVLLRTQPFATPEKAHDVAMETYRNLKTKLPGVQRSMALYLANRDTESILFRPIKVNVQQCFGKLSQLLLEHYTEEDRLIVACPTAEQISLLLASAARQSLQAL